MSEFTQLRAKLAAHARYAKYSHEDNVRMSEAARSAARTKLEADIIERYQLDPSAPDFDARLQHGISQHYTAMRLRRVSK